MNKQRRGQSSARGFTLIEMAITTSVIAIVASLAVPSLQQARKSANEGAAIANLKTIASVMSLYRSRFGTYPMAWKSLRSSGSLDGYLGEVYPPYEGAPNVGGKAGYSFLISSISGIPWRVFAVPNEFGVTGDRYFYVDASGVIRESRTGLAGPSSTPIEGKALLKH